MIHCDGRCLSARPTMNSRISKREASLTTALYQSDKVCDKPIHFSNDQLLLEIYPAAN
jgi:hypothetical protein